MRTVTTSALTLALLTSSGAALAGDCAKRGPGMASLSHGTAHPAYAVMHQGMNRPVYGSPYHGSTAGYGFYKTSHHEGGKGAMADKDIVDVAVSAGSFDTLATALTEAGLVDTLKGKGPFTVFAPTDEAFAKIPEADLKALLADKEALTRVLTYHVVPGKVMAADVVKLTSAETVQGQSFTISTEDGVMVDGAKVVKTDIPASNGVIHVIDTVLMPK